MRQSSLLHALHDIEEFLRSWKSREGRGTSVVLYYGPNINRREKDILGLAKSRGIVCKELGKDRFYEVVDKEFGTGRPGGLRHMIIKVPAEYVGKRRSGGDLIEHIREIKKEHSLVLVLDGITDPHNVGAILRSADLMDVTAVILPKRRSAEVNDTVRTVSAGASHHVEVFIVSNLSRTLEQLKGEGYWVYAADKEGRWAHSLRLAGKAVLVLGSEGKGVSSELRKHSDEVLSIPSGGHIDSFNVSVAAGILMYEIRRQTGFPFGSG